MKQYRYCSVRPKDMDKLYSYISDIEIPVNSYVVMPFGYRNHLRKGIAESVGMYTAENAPYPVRKTKRILRVITEEEYYADEDTEWNHYAESFADDIEELSEYIADENYDAVFEWACEHHNWTRFPDIMETVVQCYRLCIAEGNPAAALNLGSMYYNGTYLQRDYNRAVKLYEIAAAPSVTSATATTTDAISRPITPALTITTSSARFSTTIRTVSTSWAICISAGSTSRKTRNSR